MSKKNGAKHRQSNYFGTAAVERIGHDLGFRPELSWKKSLQPTGDLRTRQFGRVLVGTEIIAEKLKKLEGALFIPTTDGNLYVPYTRIRRTIRDRAEAQDAKKKANTLANDGLFAPSFKTAPDLERTEAMMNSDQVAFARIGLVFNPDLQSEVMTLRDRISDTSPALPSQQCILLGRFSSIMAANSAITFAQETIPPIIELGPFEALPLDN